MRKIFISSFTAILFFTACNHAAEKKTETAQLPANEFKIDGAIEHVDSTYQNGKHKVATYLDAKTNERVASVKFHENGQPYTDLRFKNGVKNGTSYSYYEDGKPWSLNNYRNDTLVGEYKTWHPNGQLYFDGFYKDGLQDGEFIKYYDNGKLDTRGFYKNGEKAGVWTTYNKEGKLMREVDYDKK
jgi:antitoxin component YwqK of YwqJK toxin-antitoxin module